MKTKSMNAIRYLAVLLVIVMLSGLVAYGETKEADAQTTTTFTSDPLAPLAMCQTGNRTSAPGGLYGISDAFQTVAVNQSGREDLRAPAETLTIAQQGQLATLIIEQIGPDAFPACSAAYAGCTERNTAVRLCYAAPLFPTTKADLASGSFAEVRLSNPDCNYNTVISADASCVTDYACPRTPTSADIAAVGGSLKTWVAQYCLTVSSMIVTPSPTQVPVATVTAVVPTATPVPNPIVGAVVTTIDPGTCLTGYTLYTDGTCRLGVAVSGGVTAPTINFTG